MLTVISSSALERSDSYSRFSVASHLQYLQEIVSLLIGLSKKAQRKGRHGIVTPRPEKGNKKHLSFLKSPSVPAEDHKCITGSIPSCQDSSTAFSCLRAQVQ